jgi:glycosyltransferase involved in cell wall biosynthesis
MVDMRMRILFDSQIFCLQEYGGISRYFASLAREMNLLSGVDAFIVAPLYVNQYLGSLPNGTVRGTRVGGRGMSKALLCAGSSLASEPAFWRMRPDIIHETYYYPQVRWFRRGVRVVSIYDMNYEVHPELFVPGSLPKWKRMAAESADHVICISENTKRDLLRFTDVREEKVSVTYLGYDPLEPAGDLERSPEMGSTRPYMLYVGSRTGCKNFAFLLEVFASSAWMRESFDLWCFGGGEFSAAERLTIERLGLEARVAHKAGGDAALAKCYRGARLFVYPSLYEGFGIPPLEAMSLDCPVACSNSSSLPEVVGDAAAMFDPKDANHMRSALESVLNSEALRNSLIARGRLRCQEFSWKRCARETLDVYRKAMAID